MIKKTVVKREVRIEVVKLKLQIKRKVKIEK